ncbi:MAG: alpha-1,2-fucosyltransferase [Proteobacteria bacterium]|nr:alpha-1,2-fucosyltransferase [Pseudomonadota bacterium]
MIITKLQGGLGNQMFQYAAGMALAHHHRTVLKLDVFWYKNDPNTQPHDRYGLNCFNVTEQFATKKEVASFFPDQLSRTDRSVIRLLRSLGLGHLLRDFDFSGSAYLQKDWDFDPAFWKLPDNCYLEGYFQNEPFFEPIQETLRSHFTFRFPASEKVLSWAELIGNSKNPVFVHFRRGDYLGKNSVYGALGLDYYRRALELLKSRLGTLTVFVFSDDIDSVERDLRLDVPHHFVRATEHYNFYDKIRLMSLCNHAIISNSTFAWWGAWLVPNKDKIVVAPKPWHGDVQFKDLNPALSSWIGLDRNGVESLAP